MQRAGRPDAGSQGGAADRHAGVDAVHDAAWARRRPTSACALVRRPYTPARDALSIVSTGRHVLRARAWVHSTAPGTKVLRTAQ